MRYSPYPKYKPSDVEWVGDVPDHWDVRRSDGIVDTERLQISPEDFIGEDVFHYSIPAIQEFGTGIVEEGEGVESGKQKITEPVVIVSRLNPRKATICVAKPQSLTTIASTEFVVLKAKRCELQFLNYLVHAEHFRQRLHSRVQSVTRSHQRVNTEEIYRFWSAWPSEPEQKSIASFLDYQTALIDALVGKRQKLIDKLKEKRTALISRTVTRGLPPEAAKAAGLNPHPKLKPSGVEWLGEIPEHWDSGLIKRWYHVHLGKMLDGNKQEGDGLVKPYLRAANIHWSAVLTDDVNEMKFTESERSWYRLRLGDLLVTEGGVTVGRSAIWQEELDECYFQNSLNRVRPKRGSNIKLLYYWLYAAKHNGLTDLIAEKSTFGHLTKEKLEAFDTVFVPEPEAGKIVAFLDHETAKIDRMVVKVEEAIEKLQEYRTALITAAVTGKIDVRGLT